MCANFWKAASISSWVTGVLVGNGLINDCRYKFSLDFFNSFFNFALLQLWNTCTNLRKAAHNCYWITGILAGNGLIIDCRYGFLLNFLILFLFCSITATKYVCKILKGCVHWFLSYRNFDGKCLINDCRYGS